MQFAVKLFKTTVSEEQNKNVLISPLSVMTALAMTANGADGETKDMDTLLSSKTPKLQISNSIWIRDLDDLIVEESFSQTNANYYVSY